VRRPRVTFSAHGEAEGCLELGPCDRDQ
jgi:hypothetical protein